MPAPLVFARPERLRRFRATAGALAEGLALRRAALVDAVDRYRLATERRYEAEVEDAGGAVRALGVAVEELGAWVGLVGDAFAELPGLRGLRLGPLPVLLAGLPPELQVEPAGRWSPPGGGGPDLDLAGAGFTLASVAATGAHVRDLDAVAALLGRGSAAGSAVADVASSPRGLAVGRFLDEAQAVAAGAREGWQRWEAEAGRDDAERAGRAVLDGGLNAIGGYGGSALGAEVGLTACASSVIAAPICASIGARGGGALGTRAAEVASDWILGDEPEPWERDPVALADEVADVDDELAAELDDVLGDAESSAADNARRHADFVIEHPWVWDDEYADAPSLPAPPPPPAAPRTGPC